jgi:tetratricopeptide (TPR) repeat protein
MQVRFLPLPRRFGLPIAASLLLGLVATACSGDRTPATEFSSAEIDSAAAQLRAFYRLRDFEGGAVAGQKWESAGRAAAEPRAWYLSNLARHSRRYWDLDRVIEQAEELVDQAPRDGWSWYALTNALRYAPDSEQRAKALSASLKALDREPDNLDFIQLRAEILRSEQSNEAALEYLDNLPPELQQNAEMVVRRATTLYFQSLDLTDDPDAADALRTDAFSLFATARELDPGNLNAWYLPGAYLSNLRRTEEALPLLNRAAEMSPLSSEIHEAYWRAVMQRQDIGMEEKRQIIQSGIDAVLAERGDYPGMLSIIAFQYEELEQPEKKTETEDRILELAPESVAAEWVYVNRYRDLWKQIEDIEQAGQEPDPALRAEYRRMLEAFIARPGYNRETLLGDAYRQLFWELRDDEDVDPDYLWEVADGVVKYEGINIHVIYAQVPVALADHDTHLEEAEEIARDGFAEAERVIASYRERGLFDTEGEEAETHDWFKSMLTDAIGWIYFKDGRVEDAEEELLAAIELSPRHGPTFYHLGQLYESRGDFDRAEQYYIRGVGVEVHEGNPSDPALKDLYVKRTGSDDGYESYLARIDDIDRERRRIEVLAEVIEDRGTLVPFTLKDLATGEQVSSESMAGKILAINFWGTWCGPCVLEMPEFQKFHEEYRNDPDVVVLTINNDTNPDVVAPWMEKRGFDYVNLLDDGYVGRMGVQSFPTTWFVDREGRIAFIKEGWSESLAEEFSWRVEVLRESGR